MEKITMLGVSNSGKTCFIYAMYDFMQKVQNGFTFITKDPDVDLDLNEGWESIAFDGIWPEGTQQTLLYEFAVLFKSNPIMEFSWCDYRGGAITERSTEQDVKELHGRIFDSGCLIICIGADTIKEIIDGNYRRRRELIRLNNLISRFGADNKRRIPIIFALTKADLYTTDDYKKLLGIIKEYFSSLYVEGANWLHAIVPVTLGKFKDTSSNRIEGVVSPKNVHVPVLFFLHSILKERIIDIQNKLSGITINRNNYKAEIRSNQGKTWWNKLWNGDNTRSLNSQIHLLNEEEKNISAQLEELERAFDSMGDMFKVCKVFYENQEIKI